MAEMWLEFRDSDFFHDDEFPILVIETMWWRPENTDSSATAEADINGERSPAGPEGFHQWKCHRVT